MLKLAVIGDPVEHSASPALHRAFLDASGIDGAYEAIRVAAGDGARAIDELRALGYAGLNVTTPLKEEAFARADERDAIAIATGAVNTLVLGPRIVGYNTDGIGTIGALVDAGLHDLANRRVLVLGAGPTARAAVAALVTSAVVTYVWNRTAEKAESIARDLGAHVFSRGAARFDAVFSTMSPGADVPDPELRRVLLAAPIVVDANYATRATLGERLGRRDVRDGRTMLAASARASFELFTKRSGSAR
ncbi:MAG: hypothetical protein NVS2B8_04930 [Vulcanimicrobiaceae bacterium]